MVWTVIPDSDIDPDSPVTTGLVTALRDNPGAMAAGDSGAPKVVYGAMTFSNNIVQGDIANSAIGQGELKTTTQTMSVSGSSSSSGDSYPTLSGGRFTLGYDGYISNGTYVKLDESLYSTSGSYVSTAHLVSFGTSGTHTGYIRSEYVQASPPYDLGDGDVPLFVFIVIDNITKDVEHVSISTDAPWHYNGPTSIIASRKDSVSGKSYQNVKEITAELRTDNMSVKDAIAAKRFTADVIADRLINDAIVEMELTQEIKQADMPLIPHPYIHAENNLVGKTVMMLDPVSTDRLAVLHAAGENVNELLHNGTIKINNSPLVRATPQGVQAFGFIL